MIHADQCYHVLNRANRRAEIFHEPADYAAFIALMVKAQVRIEVPILAACLMPNHIHLVLVPRDLDSLHRALRAVHSQYAQRINRMRGLRP